jgi:hypothetical protein
MKWRKKLMDKPDSTKSSTDFDVQFIKRTFFDYLFPGGDNPSGTSTIFDNRYGLPSLITEINENYLNNKRLRDYQNQFSSELIGLLTEGDFEYGIRSKADILVQEKMQENALATKTWLNHIFIENFDNVPILLGVLRIVARLNYFQIYPEGPTMAVAALSHKNNEVQECGIRAFESWDTLESYNVLINLKGRPAWLQEYIEKVVDGLRKKYNA